MVLPEGLRELDSISGDATSDGLPIIWNFPVILSIIFILILASLIGVNVQLNELIRISKKQDFTTEDAQVTALTEQVADAARRLPKKEK